MSNRERARAAESENLENNKKDWQKDNEIYRGDVIDGDVAVAQLVEQCFWH